MALGIIEPMMSILVRAGNGTYELAPLPQGERDLIHSAELSDGTFQFVNADPISQNYNGAISWSFVDDFYYRIYVIPTAIDFGAVVTTISRPITIWNAFFDDVTLQSAVSDGTQVSFTGDALPYLLPALNIQTWDFGVTGDGPPTIDETYTLTFDTGDAIEIEVTGTRSLLWPFLPNWRTPVTISREFSTDIITSRGGQEQRQATRNASRKKYDFMISALDAAKLRRYRQLMVHWQDRPFVIADPARTAKTTEIMAAADTNVQLDRSVSWLSEDVAVVLHNKTTGTIGLRIVDTVDSNNLVTFKDADTTDWPVGTVVSCGVVAQLIGDRNGSRVLNTAMEVNVQFMQLPGSEIEIIRDPENIWNGRELFLRRPNWGQSVNAQDMYPVDVIDYGRGRVEYYTAIEFASQIWSGQYLGRDSDTIEELLHLFERMRGRQGEFYMPTWEYDIVPIAALQSGTVGLRVAGTDFLTIYADDPTSRAVLVELNDGTQIYRAIDEIIEINDVDGIDTLIQMTETWADTIAVADIARVCWVKVWRFATDTLVAEFVTDSVANMQMSMQSLEDLPAESEESASP